MKKEVLSIAIDMDGVIADTVGQFIRWYHKEEGVLLDRKYFEGKHEEESLPGGAVRRYVTTEGFFRDVPVMEGAIEGVRELMKHYEVFIVSAAIEFPQSLDEKLAWLNEHFPFISWTHIVFCGKKNIIGTDYMIDDYLKNLDYFKGKALLYTAGHNRDVTHHTRVNNWSEVVTLLT